MERFVCVHGHFYQPPRENPWLEEVEIQESAYPYHDWNQRITAECYAPNAASRILGEDKRIVQIVNNYGKISFNFGPTLLSWLERHKPQVYLDIIESDLQSREQFSGHGSALAQCYNHMIMPLASARDKRTQIRWGVRDFELRFRRKPEGMWLPETAVDTETLEMLAEAGIKFTILAPRQAQKVRRIGSKEWTSVEGEKIDPQRAYLTFLPSGNTITIFFYDGPISRDLGFGDLLNNGEAFANRLVAAFPDKKESRIVHAATDGETFGHHHRYGDMALTYCLSFLEKNGLAKITNYAEYLNSHPAEYEVKIYEDSSWSCVHGIERWRSDCGCNSGMHAGWSQQWRAPLREAMDWLRDRLGEVFEKESGGLLADPWAVRDDYIEVVADRSEQNVNAFFVRHQAQDLSLEQKQKVLCLLEMQRHGMLIFTSCGWFFDEITGIEPSQVLAYAARAIQLAEEVSGVSLREKFAELLRNAPSNIEEFEHAADFYETYIEPMVLDLLRVGAHYAVSSLFEDYPDTTTLYTYTITRHAYERIDLGKKKLVTGRVTVRSLITWKEDTVTFVVL
ncbi:MAG: DUF3536 domain-containing protein, partial [Candidatus Omnitrophica bacterium]|nr:DUF3536 domain-containing protein [Candidatus Omnitrophota bacterium]